jgi:4'-phosphopantetheinyl transferase
LTNIRKINSFLSTIPYYKKSDWKESNNFYNESVEVFYAQSKDLNSFFLKLKLLLSKDEQIRADKFLFEEDRKTYIISHAVLKTILSKNLNKKPFEISLLSETKSKPIIVGNPIFFNLTHTRDAFAFAISKQHYVGIDLEKINQSIDFISIMKKYFSKKERDYILESGCNPRNRFFLLWTRKESLLKALGIGIINELSDIDVIDHVNVLNRKSFSNLVFDSVSNEHFICSKKLSNYYLSIAIPRQAKIILHHLNEDNINSYLDHSLLYE